MARTKIIQVVGSLKGKGRIADIQLPAAKWVGDASLYSQVATIEGITESSQVDLTPSIDQLKTFYDKDLAFVAENEGGLVTVYALGQKPENDYVMQVTVTETDNVSGKVVGTTVGTTLPKPNFEQTDPTKGDYIKNKPDFDGLQIEIAAMKAQLSDLLYEPISISKFTHNAGTKERGAVVTSVELSWETNKTPATLTLDGESLDVSVTGKTITGLSITWDNNKTWTLKVADDREAEATKTTSITFCNNIYYGVGTVEGGFDNAFVTGLSKRLQTSKAYDFTVNPSTQYIYYAVPTRLGAVTFKVGGFEGGFEAPVTVSVTNGSGYTENYYVYRSTNKITGSTSVDVT